MKAKLGRSIAAAVLLSLLVVESVLHGRVPVVTAQGSPQFTIQDLGTLGGSSSEGVAMNETGMVVGFSFLPGDAAYHAFAWTSATGMTDLGTLGGTNSQASAVNDAGMVVGRSFLPGNAVEHAFLWTLAGGMVDLGTVGGYPLSYATAINNNGLVVGQATNGGSSPGDLFAWTQANGIINVDALSGTAGSQAIGLNEAGSVVGIGFAPSDGRQHGFIWSQANGMRYVDGANGCSLDGAGFTSSAAFAISATEMVVGECQLGNLTKAFAWTQTGGMVSLGTLGGFSSRAYAVNNNGVVVGVSSTSGNFAAHPFMWTLTQGMVDIDPNGRSAPGAFFVNDNGFVVGQGVTTSGHQYAFGWTGPTGIFDLGTLGGSSAVPRGLTNGGTVVGSSQVSGDLQWHATVWRPASQSGTISVTTNLSAAAFTIDGPGSNDYAGSGTTFSVTNAPVGDYTITYGAVPGFLTPATETHTLSPGSTIAFASHYLPQAGFVQLTISKGGSGTGVVVSDPAGINCGPTCVTATPLNTKVTLTAVDDAGSIFVGWSQIGCGSVKVCKVPKISGNLTVQAFFMPVPSALSKIIFVGVCGAGAVVDDPCLGGDGWYDPRASTRLAGFNPLDDGQLDTVAFAFSGLDSIGLRISALHPGSVTLITGFNVASGIVDTFLLRKNAASIAAFVEGAYNPGDRVFLAGHSYGGGIVQDAADVLRRKGIPVAMTGQIDSIGIDAKVSTNVARAFNFYHPQFNCSISGETNIVGKQQTIVTNTMILNPYGPDSVADSCGAHKNMDNEPSVWRPIMNYILANR